MIIIMKKFFKVNIIETLVCVGLLVGSENAPLERPGTAVEEGVI
jgi:hypothetical protein